MRFSQWCAALLFGLMAADPTINLYEYLKKIRACPYVFDAEQAKAMAQAGADILVEHAGLTTKVSIGAETALTLDDCCVLIREIIKAGRSVF